MRCVERPLQRASRHNVPPRLGRAAFAARWFRSTTLRRHQPDNTGDSFSNSFRPLSLLRALVELDCSQRLVPLLSLNRSPPLVREGFAFDCGAAFTPLSDRMTESQSQLTSALNSNDTKSVNALVQSGTPIHDLSAHSSHTPLQHALALSSPQPLRSLLAAYFASSSTSHLQERDAVLDTLTQHLNPSFTFSSSAALEQKSPTPSPAAQSASSLLERVERALAAIRRGEFVVVTDGEDRENEGDLIIDAQYATAERIAYMVNETSGIICVGLSAARAQRLQLPPMVERNTESHQTAFTVTVDYNRDPLCSTGISAYDRAATIRALASDETQPAHFNRPGHVFPLVAKDGGVLERPGHTEASVELSRLSGGPGVGVMCELVRRDGAMMRPAELVEWSRRQGWELISIAELIEYRKQTGK